MSCLKADLCKKYQKNVGNPYTHQDPCNECENNISDYELGYQKGESDGRVLERAELQKAFNRLHGAEYSWQEICDLADKLKEQK